MQAEWRARTVDINSFIDRRINELSRRSHTVPYKIRTISALEAAYLILTLCAVGINLGLLHAFVQDFWTQLYA